MRALAAGENWSRQAFRREPAKPVPQLRRPSLCAGANSYSELLFWAFISDSEWLVAASTTAATATAATVPAAIAAPASAVASTAAGVLGFGAGLVDVQRASADLRAIQRSDGLFSILVAGHFHKAEPARPPGIAVGHDADPVHLTVRLKHLPQFFFRCVKAQVAYKNILHASASALSCQKCKLDAADWQVGDTFLKIGTGAGEQSNAARSIAGLSNWLVNTACRPLDFSLLLPLPSPSSCAGWPAEPSSATVATWE